MCEQFGEQWWRAWGQRNLALALWRAGDRDRSGEVVVQSLRNCRDLNEQLCGALCLEICAWKAAADKDYLRAAVLFGTKTSIWDALSIPPFWQLLDEDLHWEQQIRRSLSATAFEAAFSRGLQMSFDQALAYGLDELDPFDRPDAAVDSSVSRSGPVMTRILKERDLRMSEAAVPPDAAVCRIFGGETYR